eukprot:4061965-Lingulodinium_polyedra.AAC.1
MDDQRVEEVAQIFVDGQLGMSILRKPSVLSLLGQPKLGSDGKRLLCDGEHTVLAVVKARGIHASDRAAARA